MVDFSTFFCYNIVRQIKSTLFDLSYEYKFNFSSIDEVISNTKDLSQIDRLFVLMREVVLEN